MINSADIFALFWHLNVEINVALSHKGQFSPLDRVAISIPLIASNSFPPPSAKLPQWKKIYIYLNVHFVYLLFCHYGTCISHAILFGERNCFTKIRLEFLFLFGNKWTMKCNITSTFYQTSSKQMSSYSTSMNLSFISTVWMQKRRKFTVKESFDVKFTAWPPSDSTKYVYSPLLTNAKLNHIVVEIEH